MTFDEFRHRNLPPEDPLISTTDSQAKASFFRDPAAGDSAVEDLDHAEMSRFLEWLEEALLLDDLGEAGA